MSLYYEIIFALFIVFLVFFVRKILSKIIIFFAKKALSKTFLEKFQTISEPIQRHMSTLIVWLSIVIALHVLRLPRNVQIALMKCTKLLLLVFVAMMIDDIICSGFAFFIKKRSANDRAMSGLLRFCERLTKSVVWIIFVAIFISACGFSISGLLTTIGLGGAAVALASKDSLANLFGSVALITDHVFKVGDNIKFGETVEGTVEDIGLRSTKVRTISRSLITIPNATLANAVIDNLSQIGGRFVSQTLFFDSRSNEPDKISIFIKKLSDDLKNCPRICSVSVLFFDLTEIGLQVSVSYVVPREHCSAYLEIRGWVNDVIFMHTKAYGLDLVRQS